MREIRDAILPGLALVRSRDAEYQGAGVSEIRAGGGFSVLATVRPATRLACACVAGDCDAVSFAPAVLAAAVRRAANPTTPIPAVWQSYGSPLGSTASGALNLAIVQGALAIALTPSVQTEATDTLEALLDAGEPITARPYWRTPEGGEAPKIVDDGADGPTAFLTPASAEIAAVVFGLTDQLGGWEPATKGKPDAPDAEARSRGRSRRPLLLI